MELMKTTQSFNSRCYLFSIYFVLQTKSKLFTHLSIVLCLKFQYEYAVIYFETTFKDKAKKLG